MKLFIQIIILLFNKFILRRSTGYCLRVFCQHSGIAYIKLCQMLAMQNIGNIFTEQDRKDIMAICYDINPIPYRDIKQTLRKEYCYNLRKYFPKIYSKPVGSASVSQVHRAILRTTGEEVVLKVKRTDVHEKVIKDVNVLRFLSHKFGWVVGITNSATTCAWEYYIQWLSEELDFEHEVKNLHRFAEFAESVNGKVPNTGNIHVPKVYAEYCTSNVIVMEYIPHKTISSVNDSDVVNKALGDYIKLSFYAMFHDLPVIYHGDMHPGNLYIDDSGELGFLDLGLIFELSPKDEETTRKLFLYSYFGNLTSLYEILEPWIRDDTELRMLFKKRLAHHLKEVQHKPLASYFMDVLLICLDVDINPPYFLFCMAKAFVCIWGADTVYSNAMSGKDLVGELVTEYMINAVKDKTSKLARTVADTIVATCKEDESGVSQGLICIQSSINDLFNWIKDTRRRIKEYEGELSS